MRIKGSAKFREKTPWFSGKKIYILPVYALCILSLSIAVMTWFDSVPGRITLSEVNPIILSSFPLIGELLVCVVGFLMIYQMWLRRDRLRTKYGQLSYQHICLVGFAGVGCWLSLVINLFIPYWSFSPSFWIKSPLQLLVLPLESYVPMAGPVLFWVRMTLAILFSAVGIMMFIRSLQTFGFDYMAVVYLYFPEESKLQNHEIYSVLRHPAYAGILTVGLGGMFFTFTLYSIIFLIVFILAFYIHIYFVEEKELIQRFGTSFQEYRRNVPALVANPRKMGVFLDFLLREPNTR
jgi:protein-S-isoprenylcysteine O-methyltransferase Ste14